MLDSWLLFVQVDRWRVAFHDLEFANADLVLLVDDYHVRERLLESAWVQPQGFDADQIRQQRLHVHVHLIFICRCFASDQIDGLPDVGLAVPSHEAVI